MREDIVYLRLSPSVVVSETGSYQLLDNFRLMATQSLRLVGNTDYDGESRNTFLVETTYSCRLRVPKYLRKIVGKMTEEEKILLKNTLLELLRQKGFNLADRGYQPYSGWIEIESSQIDKGYSLKNLNKFYKEAYAIFKEFKRPYQPTRKSVG